MSNLKTRPIEIDGAVTVAETSQSQFCLGIVTAAGRHDSVRKKIDYCDGAIVKDRAHHMGISSGSFQDESVLGMAGLAHKIESLTASQALTLGSCGRDQVQALLSSKKLGELDESLESPDNYIARTKEFLKFSGEAFPLLIDVDAAPGQPRLTPDEVRTLLGTVIPGFEDLGYVVTQSSSSHIYHSETGECLAGDGNFHLFILARGDVGSFAQNLKTLFWAAGRGRFMLANPNKQTGVSSVLERFPIDMCVFSPERLVYEAGAILPLELEQRRGNPIAVEGAVLDLDAIVPSKAQSKIGKEAKHEAHQAIHQKRTTQTIAHIRKNDPTVTGEALGALAKEAVFNTDRRVLSVDHILHFEDGTEIAAGDLTKELHLGKKLRDPQEPDYDGGRCCAKVIPLTGGGVGISSFAHGECQYQIANDSFKACEFTQSLFTRNEEKGTAKFRPPVKIAQAMDKYWTDLRYDYQTESFWEYSGGVWSDLPKIFMLDRVTKALERTGLGFSTDIRNSAYDFLSGKKTVKNWQEPNGLIPMKNGVLVVNTMRLLPHSKDYGFRWQLPYDYSPAATCQPIEDWLMFTQHDDVDRVQLLRAYLRAIITEQGNLQRFMEVVATVGGSGKSTFCNLAIALVGIENTHITDSNRLEQSRFETACFKGKKLIYFADSGQYSGSKAIDILKRVTGGDTLAYERKNKDARDPFVYRGMVLIAANAPLHTSDSAIPRRRITVPFIRPVHNREQRVLTEINSELNTMTGEFAEYLPGLFNWVMGMSADEMRRYLKDTDRAVPGLSETKAETLIQTNPLAAWLDECCVFDDAARTSIGKAERLKIGDSVNDNQTEYTETYKNENVELYANYRKWIDSSSESKKSISLQRFTELLVELCQTQCDKKNVCKKRGNSGVFISGLALRSQQPSYENAPRPISGALDDQTTPTPEDVWESIPPDQQASVKSIVDYAWGIPSYPDDDLKDLAKSWMDNNSLTVRSHSVRYLKAHPEKGLDIVARITKIYPEFAHVA
jgi:phage/plasmid-associated DNA primase